MNNIKIDKRWGILMRSDNRLDGKVEHLLRYYKEQNTIQNCNPILFPTRAKAREYRQAVYSYLNPRSPDHRKDLAGEPHGWKFPKVVKLLVQYKWGD